VMAVFTKGLGSTECKTVLGLCSLPMELGKLVYLATIS
jgi:hypothetical protein